MSVPNVSPTSNSIQPHHHGHKQELRQDFNDLGSALLAGNLAGAQQAFAALQQMQGQFGQQGGQAQNDGQQGDSFAAALISAVSNTADVVAADASSVSGATTKLGSGFNMLDQILAAMQQSTLSGMNGQGGVFEMVSLTLGMDNGANPLAALSSAAKGADQMLAMLEQQLGISNGQSSGGMQQVSASAESTIGKDMAALGQALQAGSLSSAQQDFSQLKQALDSAAVQHGHRRHHHHGGSGNVTAQQQNVASTYASVSTNGTNSTGITVSNAGSTDTAAAVAASGAAASTTSSTNAPLSLSV